MHDLLYERRAPITEPQLEDYAKALGLDLVTFMKDLHSRQVLERVREDEVGGLRGGVIGTPTFFVNGLHFRDKLDLDSLSRSIGAALLRSRGVHSRTW